MPKNYNVKLSDEKNGFRACITNAEVSFKNTRETCSTLKGRTLANCFSYLQNVIDKKECVPMRRYSRGCGRTPQASKFSFVNKENKFIHCDKGRWPRKSAEYMLKVCKNIKNNAALNNVEPKDLIVRMVSVNKAPKKYGRCYRAYGRVNPFNKSPCHIQMVCVKRNVNIQGEGDVVEIA